MAQRTATGAQADPPRRRHPGVGNACVEAAPEQCDGMLNHAGASLVEHMRAERAPTPVSPRPQPIPWPRPRPRNCRVNEHGCCPRRDDGAAVVGKNTQQRVHIVRWDLRAELQECCESARTCIRTRARTRTATSSGRIGALAWKASPCANIVSQTRERRLHHASPRAMPGG